MKSVIPALFRSIMIYCVISSIMTSVASDLLPRHVCVYHVLSKNEFHMILITIGLSNIFSHHKCHRMTFPFTKATNTFVDTGPCRGSQTTSGHLMFWWPGGCPKM